ncbi:MAG TPA: hypothetical protein VFV87_20010 [Pirellulaceae bacterium]|nr:hypothetical protein [Pirellulaceae bacterium]
MRYRLRTLLIVLAIAPPMLAVTWWTAVVIGKRLSPHRASLPKTSDAPGVHRGQLLPGDIE